MPSNLQQVRRFALPIALLLAPVLTVCPGCSQADSAAQVRPIRHLADALDRALVASAAAPATAGDRRHWSFHEGAEGWSTISSAEYPFLAGVEQQQVEDGVSLALKVPAQPQGPLRIVGLKVDVGELDFEDWASVLVEARTGDRFAGVTVGYNVDERAGLPSFRVFFESTGEAPPMFNDGSSQTYAIPLRTRAGSAPPDSLTSIGLFFAAPGPAKVDILGVTLVPRGASFLEDVGARQVARGGTTRQSLFAHAPARLVFPVSLHAKSRFDFALTVDRGESVTYRVGLERDGEVRVAFEQTVDDAETWRQCSVDLSQEAPGAARIVLTAESARAGAVAIWGAPLLAGADATPTAEAARRPNVLFYVIDGGDADLMSLYGYGRPTTPFLEQLAQEGVVFTRAHSNATWTQPSTASFMTSLQHSVLGGLRRGIHSTAIPPEAVTLADHFRAAGYVTASFSANPNSGRIIGTDKGMDVMRDTETAHHATSSLELHEMFFELQADYPGGPYFTHFQTTDVHEPNEPVAPFARTFTTAEDLANLERWEGALWGAAGAHFGTTSVVGFYDIGIEEGGVDRQGYFGVRRALYDETMLHQDFALEELISHLKETGEWENTLLVIGSDHGHPAGTFARFGHGELDPQPEPWQGAMFDAYATRIPLLFLWPGHIEGGRRFDQPVSMIDVLPTLLDLVGLPQPEIVQGQSLAPLLRGEAMDVRPVILDEFRVDAASGEMVGNIEIIDGRWGASLELGSGERGRHSVPAGGRWGAVHPFFPEVPRLLLYDLENDPFTTHAVNDEHPELVEHYTALLLEQWRAHQALAQRFGDAGDVTMDADQLEQLRALGYIR